MQTQLPAALLATDEGREADAILRKCVHCGFCTATCPTYQLLGDELDGPRGRIYLIKEFLEGSPASHKTQLHLDRCLTCRACETTCPSGVRFGRLLDIGRTQLEPHIRRSWRERLMRRLLLAIVTRRVWFAALLAIGRGARRWLPKPLRHTIPLQRRAGHWPAPRHARRMLVLQGCVQPAAAPAINAAAARLLDRVGISLVAVNDGCCGAMAQHLGDRERALSQIRHNIDAWWPEIERGAEAVIATASGCGVTLAEYGELLRDDPIYAAKAARVSALFRDVSQVVAAEIGRLPLRHQPQRIAVQTPCTLQHGLKQRGVIEKLLVQAGFLLTPVADAHLCCGSAGSYSLLQQPLSRQLRANKLRALEAGAPEIIATANIGCLLHLQTSTELPVMHWIELLEERLS
jgi:glycolate oxidase iron-sulfur subunit